MLNVRKSYSYSSYMIIVSFLLKNEFHIIFEISCENNKQSDSR